MRHPGVRQAAATARGNAARVGVLAGYVVPHAGVVLTAAELRQALRHDLPEYMVPTHLTFLAALPLTATGKVDRAALPAPEPTADVGRTVVAPRTDVERDLQAIWEDVLGVRPVGVTDDFFDMGGHSYLAAVLMSQIRQRLGHTLPLGALFAAPTAAKLAAVIQRHLEAGSGGCLVPLREEGSRPPVFLIAGVGGHVFTFHKFARLLGPDQPAYGLKAIGVDGAEPPPDRVEAIAARYEAEIARRHPKGPVVLGGYSVGGLIAFELALRFRARGRPVDLLVLFDVTAPGYPRPLPMPGRLFVHLRNVIRGLGTGRATYLRERLTNLKERVLDRLGLTVLNAPTIAGVDALPQGSLKRVWAALRTARHYYQPRGRFDGRALLVKAAEPYTWAATVLDDPLLGWGRWIAGPVEVATVPGGHLEVFREGNLPLLAGELRRRLDAT